MRNTSGSIGTSSGNDSSGHSKNSSISSIHSLGTQTDPGPDSKSIGAGRTGFTHSRHGSNVSTSSGRSVKRVAYALLHWDDLPEWRRDNVYILGGYRPTSHSYVASLASVLGIHNESVNIWTHLAGALVAALLGVALYVDELPSIADVLLWPLPQGVAAHLRTIGARLAGAVGALVADYLPTPSLRLGRAASAQLSAMGAAALRLLGVAQYHAVTAAAAGGNTATTGETASSTLVLSCFAAGAVACLGMSATYHALSNHSPAVARWGNKLDYSGIVFLIVGSYVPTLYYGFFCHPRWLTVYLYLIVLLGLACLAVSWLEHFRTPAWRPYRALLFVALGMSGVVPILHGLLLLEADAAGGGGGAADAWAARYARLNERMGLNWVLLQGALYVAGAFLYAARWPEKWRPGRFDIWGSSHQIFHVCVVLAAAAHLRGCMEAYLYHHNVMGGQCPSPP
ncbi:hemolysin-iii channel protein [Sporothrix schenckii 1099-18]|uniref:Hemolysin-iii channel protein n=1 Tax=Sporothrix schenckii 1099-18 TaxID=1397361 RepID=A0A0F2M997_SPOSC|nr:hemolysin-iii channel protein [Sporothrix schenckii 1099-18]KJR86212.1 hemolysin-iii channel protein [Sporothrix schenckii 1099-18]